MRIFFTGGSGKAGRHVAPYLAELGHHVTNADLVPLEQHPAVADLRVDLTDAGETYSALAGLATFDELDLPEQPTYDAVVHFAAVPRILLTSDTATYATNVLSTYNVLEAATRLGVRKIVFASSETTYGICFAQGERRPLYVPVDEDHPTVPEDAYAMSKVAGEVTARSFHARTGADITACGSTTSSSRTSTPRSSLPFSPTRRAGVATCSPTSTPAISVRWCSAASRPMGWVTRSSTSLTPTCP